MSKDLEEKGACFREYLQF